MDDLLLFPPPVPGVQAARRELEALAEAVTLRADDLRILYAPQLAGYRALHLDRSSTLLSPSLLCWNSRL
jgi:hypothetical protein